MEQPTEKNKFSYFARSRLRLRKQEIWERDYIIDSLTSPRAPFKISSSEILDKLAKLFGSDSLAIVLKRGAIL